MSERGTSNISILLAFLHIELGDTEYGNLVLSRMMSALNSELVKRQSFWLYIFRSMIYTIRGEEEKAIENILTAQGLGIYWGWRELLQIHPVFDSLRSHPDFLSVLRLLEEESKTLRSGSEQISINDTR